MASSAGVTKDVEGVGHIPERVLFRIVRGDAEARPFGTPRNPRTPTIEEFNPRVVEFPAGELAARIVSRRHGLFPDQVESTRQMTNSDLVSYCEPDPISANETAYGLALTGGHHRTNEIIQRVRSGEMAADQSVRILLHD